jgi:hypothetical protein
MREEREKSKVKNRTLGPEGCGTRKLFIALRVLHPPENLEKRGCGKKMEERSKSAPSKIRGCGTRKLLIALRVLHPPMVFLVVSLSVIYGHRIFP